VPEVYAAVALVLSREYEWTYEQINDFFAETQAVWQEYSDSKMAMIQACLKETGIELRSMRLWESTRLKSYINGKHFRYR
jgi:alpha-D-ribose 1-methylphosphonate 5-triphosphate diphosphatase PhnM